VSLEDALLARSSWSSWTGRDLSALIRSGGPLEPAPVARIFMQACRGLADAHKLGIVHRDIKPANIFLHELPTGEIVTKICDFGVAKKIIASDGDETATDLTRTGGVLGSPMYFSPEQSKNAKHVDHRTDIWSLAVSLYEAVSGRWPCVYTRRFATRAESREAIFEFIEVFYNGTRRHSTLGYLSPMQFEMKFNQETDTQKQAA
jgi:serine/threonine protein kinase